MIKKSLTFTLLMMIILLASCTTVNEYKIDVTDELNATIIDDNYRTFYEIFVGSFSDSNDDGIGDLRGIINRLDYLNDGDPNSGLSLGIDGIWLTPIMDSTSYHKYDVLDYESIDDDFGTMDDFEDLLAETESRGINVIIDLVINHTSEYHPWFQAMKTAYRENDLDSPYRDYYVLYEEDEKPLNGTYYELYSGSGLYYEGNFSSSMPELNYDNPLVRAEIKNIIRFWLEKGVDGFRLDAAKYIYYQNTPKNIEFWSWFMDEVQAEKPDAYVIGEVWSGSAEILSYYQNFNNFDFQFSQLTGYISQTASATMSVTNYTQLVNSWIDSVTGVNSDAIIAPFITNHDMDRAAGFLQPADGLAQMAASIYILGPGNPYIYYGEEIGMKGTRGSANTDANRRLAMLWGDGDTITNPPGSSYHSDLQVNGTVKDQLPDANSLYNHYKKVIMLRNANPEIARGDYEPIVVDNKQTFGGFLSTYQGSTVGVFHNTGLSELVIDLSLYTDVEFSILRGFAGLGSASLSEDGKTLTISGLTSVVLK